MTDSQTSKEQVGVTVEGLRALAIAAHNNDRYPEFMRVVLQWAEGAQAEIARLRAAVEPSATRDAERYRFLRQPGNAIVYAKDRNAWGDAAHPAAGHVRYDTPEQLDAAIDVAIGATPRPAEPPSDALEATKAERDRWWNAAQDRTVENVKLRELLALAYSAGHLYGDDGELQDNRLPPIDYYRDSVADIERKMNERGMERLRAELTKNSNQAGASSVGGGMQAPTPRGSLPNSLGEPNPTVNAGDGRSWDREAAPCADAGINAASELSDETGACRFCRGTGFVTYPPNDERYPCSDCTAPPNAQSET